MAMPAHLSTNTYLSSIMVSLDTTVKEKNKGTKKDGQRGLTTAAT
jgi:hypothetical protein